MTKASDRRTIALLKAQQEASLDALLVVDERELVVSFNRRFLDMFQISRHLASGAEAEAIFHAIGRAANDNRVFTEMARSIVLDEVVRRRDELALADGRVLDCYTAPVTSDQGEHFGRIWFFRDITLRKTIEAELMRLATTDELTGLSNRHAFFEILDREYRRAARHGRTLAVMMLDVDRFKRVNDEFGHAVGDEVLRMVTSTATKALRATDYAGRIGGEEFAFVLPETDADGAAAVAERVRAAVEESVLHSDRGEVRVTVSLGVAAENPASDDHGPSLLIRADDALYLAKDAGRNQVAVAK